MSYDQFASTFSKSRKNLRWPETEYIAPFMSEYFWEKFPMLLDVGCWNGRLIETLEQKSFACGYMGIDESAGMIQEAEKLHPEYAFRVCDMNNIDILIQENRCFDAILFIASFHHLESINERQEVLRKTKELLAEGGVLIMTNWNLLGEDLFSKYEAVYRGNGDFMVKIGAFERYYHGFLESELENLFQEAGFDILENRIFDGGKNIVSIVHASLLS